MLLDYWTLFTANKAFWTDLTNSFPTVKDFKNYVNIEWNFLILAYIVLKAKDFSVTTSLTTETSSISILCCLK